MAAFEMKPEYVGSGLDAKKQMGNEEKKAMVNEEMKKMQRLPPNSSYASHRLRVLNKIHQLLSLQASADHNLRCNQKLVKLLRDKVTRTSSQDEELELLFSGLHI